MDLQKKAIFNTLTLKSPTLFQTTSPQNQKYEKKW